MPMHTPTEVVPGKPWNNTHGNFQPYRLKLAGVDKIVHLNTKENSPAPTVGAPLDLTLEPHPQFDGELKASKAFSSDRKGAGRSPEENARIMRQHAQEMGLRYAAIKGKADLKLDDDFRKVIDWFDTDAKAAKP